MERLMFGFAAFFGMFFGMFHQGPDEGRMGQITRTNKAHIAGSD